MNKKKPEKPEKVEIPQSVEAEPNINMTPVEFSPVKSDNEFGSVGGYIRIQDMRFPLAIPVAIMLMTLIYSTVRDISGFNRRLHEIAQEEVPAEALLKKTREQAQFVEGIRVSLKKIAPTNPNAARFLREYYPPETQDSDAGAASTPSQ